MDLTTSLTLIIVTALACGTFIWFRTSRDVRGTAETTLNTMGNIMAPVADGVGGVASAVAERIRKKADYDRLQLEVGKLREEIAESRAHKISSSLIEPIMQLALIEIPFDHFSVKKYVLKEESEGWLVRENRREYLGIFEAKYRKKFGVDLKALRFEVRGNQIAVKGLSSTKMLGASDIKIEPWLTEVREHCEKGQIRGANSTILTDESGSDRIAHERKQYTGICEEINSSGQLESLRSMNSVNDLIQNMALAFLRSCFAPAGYDVIKDDGLSGSISFSDLCNALNERHANLLRDRQQFLEQKIQKIASLETELIGLPLP